MLILKFLQLLWNKLFLICFQLQETWRLWTVQLRKTLETLVWLFLPQDVASQKNGCRSPGITAMVFLERQVLWSQITRQQDAQGNRGDSQAIFSWRKGRKGAGCIYQKVSPKQALQSRKAAWLNSNQQKMQRISQDTESFVRGAVVDGFSFQITSIFSGALETRLWYQKNSTHLPFSAKVAFWAHGAASWLFLFPVTLHSVIIKCLKIFSLVIIVVVVGTNHSLSRWFNLENVGYLSEY